MNLTHSVDLELRCHDVSLQAQLRAPENPRALVIFAAGSGPSQQRRRNMLLAQLLQQRGLATFQFDMLSAEEEQEDQATARFRFDILMLSERLNCAHDWARKQAELESLRIGYFAAGTGAAAAMFAAADGDGRLGAIVSRGGRPDLAGPRLTRVTAPTLLLVGALDIPALPVNRKALEALRCEKSLEIVEGASHLFSENGALDNVARLAADWFLKHLDRR
ncbi:MAG: hypothetical protein K1X75_13680 [Leptospirales bacterium]|nr:hypothetical protein [Leptospirales bacterium]